MSITLENTPEMNRDRETLGLRRSGKAQLTKAQLKKIRNKRKANAALYHEALAAADELGIELGKYPGSVPDVLEKVFARTHALWQFAASQVDQLDPDAPPGDPKSIWFTHIDEQGNRHWEPSKWIELERALREELFDQGIRMGALKIDERRVRIEEKQMEVLSRALATAVSRAGLDDATKRQIGGYLREELAVIDGRESSRQPGEFAA